MQTELKSHPSTHYRIRVKERLDTRWSHWFEDMVVASSGDETILAGPVADQAALHGLLIRIRDLNLTLLSLERFYPEQENGENRIGLGDRKDSMSS